MPYEQFATPVAFNQLTPEERDALDVSAESLTIWNLAGGRLQTKRAEYWLDHVLLYGDLTFDDGAAVPGHPTLYFDEDIGFWRVLPASPSGLNFTIGDNSIVASDLQTKSVSLVSSLLRSLVPSSSTGPRFYITDDGYPTVQFTTAPANTLLQWRGDTSTFHLYHGGLEIFRCGASGAFIDFYQPIDQELVAEGSYVTPGSGKVRQTMVTKASGVYQNVPNWRDASGHDSGPVMRAKGVVPIAVSSPVATTTTNVPANNTTGTVGQIDTLEPIVLHAIHFNAGVSSVGAGSFRVWLATESGALIPATNMTVASVPAGITRMVLAQDVFLPAGRYYICFGNATAFATTQPGVTCHTKNATFDSVDAVIQGTVVMTAGAAPDPLGTITQQTRSTLFVYFEGAAT